MKNFIILFFLIPCQSIFSQDLPMRSLKELINTEEPGWAMVEDWMKAAKNDIQILPKDSVKADSALYYTQVTTRSPMGAIVYETGGILVDHGWIRILGSGSDRLARSLPEWNKGKSFEEYGEAPSFFLIADDAIGGFFALNGGGFGKESIGEVFYFSPDLLEWEPLDIVYSEFIYWTFTGPIDQFYKGLRWKKWKEEIKELNGDRAMSFFPFLWSKYDDLEELSRKDVPIEELWTLQMDFRLQFLEKQKK